jgi:hypothetical protein
MIIFIYFLKTYNNLFQEPVLIDYLILYLPFCETNIYFSSLP